MPEPSGPGAAERAAVERYFAAINARDVAAIVADLADEAAWTWPGSGEVIRGRAAIEVVVARTRRSCPRSCRPGTRTG